MKKSLVCVCVAAALGLAATSSFAGERQVSTDTKGKFCSRSVPEIDAAGASLALALLAGVVAVSRERRKK